MERKGPSPEALSAGDVLVAGPEMPDGHFFRTLVYLKEHDEQGSLGLILNRPVGQTLGQLLPGTDFPDAMKDLELYFGGPVQTDQFLLTLFRIHAPTHTFYCEINPELEDLERAMEDPLCSVRAFLGFTGWGEGQLMDEVNRRDWFWTAPDEVMIHSNETFGLWDLMVTGDFRWQKLRAYFPKHPEHN